MKNNTQPGDAVMSKLFKRLMCLLLGIVIGISATVGSIATSVYYLYGNVTVTDILPDDKDRLKDMLGDLGNYSAEDIVALFSKAIKAPENYTIADLERDYGLNLVDLINQIAGKNIIDTDDPDNKPYIDDLKSISLFALLSGQTDFKAFLSDVPLGAVLSFIPAGTILDKEQREKLRKYSVGSLLAVDENTDLPVALSALSDLTVGGVYTNMFEKDGDEYRAKEGQSQALNLVANIKLGGLLSPLTGKTTFGDELVGGGLSSIGALTLGDLYRKIGGENSEELAGRLDGFLTDADGNPVKIRDLFAKDISDGNDHYRFVLDKLLDSIKLGTFIGFSRKDGKWVATDGAGNDTEVTGLLSFLADLNITDLYHALTDSGSTSDRIHRIILVFGDLTVGHVFETLGCKRDESGKWIKSDGTEFKSKLAEKLLDFSVRDIFGDEDQELTGTQVRLNIIGAVSELCGDMTLGEGIGELFGVESAREGENVVYTKDGTRVNPALGRLFDIKLRDIVNAFGGEKIDLSEVKGVFETAIAGVYLGDMLGGEKVDGVWYKGGEKVSDALSLIYEISFNGVFSLLNELNSDNFSYSEIIRGFMPETALGDIFAIFSGIKKTGVGDDAYFVNADGTPLPKGINSFLTIRLWQYASAFDPNGRYDLNADLSDVRLGDVVSLVWKDLRDDCVRGEYENVWGTNKENGNLPLILSDVFNVDIASIINVATAKETINAEICKLLNAFTDSDNHTLGMYLDDLLKGDESESIIKKNVGVYGMLNIKIAELVSVILKEKTGLSANPDGSISKLKAESLLPSNYKDLLIYVFDNITDKVLIGDFLRNSDGSGYTYKVNTEGKLVWYDKEGKVCPVETSEVLSLPSTYIFFLIGGAVGLITGSEEFMNGLNSYQIGVILEPLYNSAFADYDSKMISVKNPDGDDYIYTARGVYELIATKLANKTFKGFCDELKSDALKVLFDRELGDYLFDTFSLILGLGDYAGIHGFASDNKDKDLFTDKYKSEKVAATAILNFNVYEFIKANDKKAYLKEAFKEVTFGDVLELTNLVVGKETSYNGRTIKAYSVPGNASTLDEGGADGNTTDKPIGYGWSGLLNTNIVNFVKALLDHKPFLEIINGGDEGDIVDVNFEVRDYIALLRVFGVEYNDEFDYEPANRLLDINVKTFLTTLLDKEKSNEEKIEYVVNIFGDLTVYDFIEFNDTLKNTDLLILKDHIYPIVVSEFIIELIEAKGTDAKLSVIKKYFGEISVGDIINIIDRTFTYLNQRRSVRRDAMAVYAAPSINKVWVRGETKLKLILSDIFNVTISNIFDIVEAAKSGVIEAIGTAAEIMFPRICEVYLNDFGIEVSSDSIFKNVKIAELGKLIREILNDPKTALKKYFGEAALGEFVNAFYSDFGRDEQSKVWGIGGKSLFLILSDLLDITVNNIIDTIDIFTKETVAKGVCEVLNIITKKDAHTLGAYLDDLLKGDKSESVIKQNVGLDGITNIKIAELVAVILKEKTGIEADKGGTLDKFGVVNSLPEDFRDLIVYICNITDKVLIGDYLRKSDNSGYTYTEGADGKKTWKNASGEACTEIISEILSLPTTYPFVIIGGIAYVISDPNGALEMLKPYKVGVVLEPIYNAAFGGIDGSKMSHLGDEQTGVYTIAGVYKAFLEELANKTFGEVMDDIKADSQCVVKYLIDRELGDLVYDLFTKIVKFGDKIGIDGLASENKTAKGYVSKKNAISAILNFNIYKLIKAEDKAEYLKEAFGSVTIGDLAEIYDKITKEEALYNGRKVNEYKLGGKTFGLGISGLLSTEIVGLIDAFTKKDGKLLDRIEAVVDIDFMIGDYLTVMDILGISYNGTAWIKNEKEVYAPLNNVLKVNVKEFVNTLTGDKSAEEKRDYIIRIFDKLTVKDFVSISDNLANLDKVLLQKHIYPIVVADVIIDFITETDKLGVAKKYFGEITIGSIANLAINVTENGGVWSDGKGEMKLIVTDVFNITVNDILGIIETIKNGGDLEAIVKQVAEVVFNERSLKEYLADLKNDKVNKIIEKDALQKLITSKIVEVVAKVFEKIGEKDYAGIITYYFDETSVGEFAQIFMDGLKKDGDVWANNGTAMKLIVSDVFDVNVDNIVEIVKSFKYIKDGINKTAEIILKRTFQAYVNDFGYDLSKKDAFAGIRDVVVSEFVAAMLENDRLDSLKNYFKDARLGDVVNVANDKFVKNGDVWANNGKAVKLILSDVLDVNVDNIAEIVKSFKYIKDGINKTAEIILKRTFQAYVKDFGYDLSEKDLFEKIRVVKVSDFVAEMLEDTRLDRLKYYFGEASVGNILELFLKIERDAEGWKKKGGEYYAVMIGDVFDINVNKVIDIKNKLQKGGDNVIAEVFNDIFPERRVGDLVNVVIPKLSDECVRGEYTNVWGMTKEKGELPLILSDVFNLRIKTILDAVLGGKEVTDIVLSITDEIFGNRITDEQDVWARTFNEYMLDLGITYVNEHDAFRKIREERVGEFIYHVLKDGDKTIDYLRGLVNDITLRNIAELALDGATIDKLPLIVRDVFDVAIGNIIDVATAGGKIKTEICNVLNVITKKDAHTLGAYLDDLLKGDKSESVIKQNVGLDGITNIKIAELVAVILKEKTGIEADKGGTLDKFGVVNSLPEDFRDLIVYICNITDKVLIGDYLRKSDNSGYTYTEGADGKKTWKNASGEACTEIISEILSLPTTYPFVIIGGIAYVISDPNGALEMLKPYKVGVVLEPIYNAAFGGIDGSKMSHLGDEQTGVYTIAGVYKAFLEELANKTFGEVMDDIKADSQCVVKYLIDRELGDLVYDLFTKIVKFGDKIGIDGLASENKTAKGYVSKKNAISAILNFNIYKLIKAEDKAEYLKEAFGSVTIGDLAEIYDKITKEEALYNGRKVNEYKLGGKTFGLGISGLLSTEIVGLIDAFTKKDGKLLDRIEAVVDIDFMIGDYLTVMDILGISYNGTAWIKNEKEVYAPLNNVLKVNVKEFVNTLTGDKSAEEKRDYIIRIFDKLTVKDFVSISDNLANLDKVLLQKHIYPIVVADVIIDFITETDKLGVAKKYFGEITIGSIANLAINVTENGGVWSDGKGEMKLIVTDVFNITVNDILGIIETIKNGGDLEAIVKQVAEVVFNERSLKEYLADLKNDKVNKIIEKDALQKLITSKIVEVVAKVFEKIGEKDYAGIITYYFDETSVGEFAQIFMDGLKKDGDVWANNGTAMKLIVSDVFDVNVDNIVEIVKSFKYIKDGINKTAEIILKRTFQAYVNDFGYDLSKKDAFAGIRDVVVSEFVAAMLENDRLDSLKNYFKDARLGDVVNVANDKFVKNGDVWANNGKAVKLILSDVLDVNVDNIAEIVKSFKYIKDGINKTAEIILKRTFQVYINDFGYDLSKKDAFAGIRDVVVSEFVAAMLENDRLDSLKNYFKDARLGDVVNVANDKFAKNGDVWANDGKAVKLILSDVLDVDVDNIVEIVKAFKNVKAGINKTAEIILKRTFQAYVKDFGYDLSKKDAFAGIRDVVVSEFVAAMLENDRLESLKKYFGETRVGDIINLFEQSVEKAGDETEKGGITTLAHSALKDGKRWQYKGKNFKLILSDLMDIEFNHVYNWIKVAKKGKVNATVETIVGDIFGENTFEDYTKDFGLKRISEKELFRPIRETKVIDFVTNLLEAKNMKARLKYLRTFVTGMKLGAIAEVADVGIESPTADGAKWTMKGKDIPYALSDILSLTFDDVFDLFFAREGETLPSWANRIVTLLNKYTLNDEHTLKLYIEDIVGKRLINKGVADLSDIRIAELVAVALKVKTGITVDEGGTLDKFNVTSQLPASFKDIIVYVCNITDKVLIGDYFTNLNNKEGGIYRNDDGVWYDKTTEVTGIRKTVYDLPTTYILGAIVLIAQPQLLLDAIKDYKIGKLIEKPYNNVMKSVDSEITNADGEYGVNGRFKELVESFVNITVEDVYNDIKGKKFVSNLREMFVNREVGDYLYDLGAWLAGKVTKRSVGLNGYAYEHVNEKGLYETDGNLQTVYGKIFNLNILTLIKQKKNIGKYLKAQFETLLLGDIFYDLGRVVTKGKLCEGYAFTNKAANEGKYQLVKSMGEVVSATFNISLKQIFDCIKGKQTLKNFGKLIKDTYGELTVGDFTYDLFRKYVAGKFKLTANGYASQFKADNTSLKGKGAKFFRATFVVKINDIIKFASDVKKNTGKKRNTVIIDFVSKVYGGLTLGDIFAPMIQKMSAKKLKMVYAYDDDYNVTVTGDFKEIANGVYSSTLKDLLAAIKGNKVKTYFVGRNDGSEDGLIGKHPAGDLLGYVFRDFMKKYFKNTDIEKDEEAGKWIAARSFSHPLNILFNDVKIADFARIKDPKTFLLDNFGDVLVGELLGKYLDKGAWYKTDGTLEEINAENGGIIMKQVYEIKFREIMDDNFNINYVIADIYVGELIGYYHCGLKYTKEDSLTARFNVCKDETHVDKNGYHIHEDECDVPLHDHSVGTNSYESGWYKDESGNIVPVTAIESVMADIRLGYMLGNSEVDFGEIFGDMTVGDVLGYEYCGGSDDCTVTVAGHTHDARVGKTWYVKESTGVRRANALERTMANVKMKDIVNGSFNIDKELTSLKLGNLMNYEYCVGPNDCYVDHAKHAAGWYKQEGSEWTMIGEELYYDADDFKKFASASLDDYRGLGTNGAGWYHKTGSGKWEINNLGEAEQGEHIGNNLTLCILDYSMSGIRSDSFSKGLMDKVNKNVRVGDIFDPVTTSGPIKLISANTAIGNISGAISGAMKVATAGELIDYGMLPLEDTTKSNMTNVYGSTLAMSWDYDKKCWKTKNGNAADDANDIVAATGTTAIGNAAMAAYKGDVPTSLTEALENTAYITTIGEAYWTNLTINQLVNVLLTRVQVSNKP